MTADYTIIMSRTLKIAGNVMYGRGAWFLRVIMSSPRALCCLLSVKKQKHDFNCFFVQCIIKQLLGNDLPFSLESVVPITHAQNVICKKTHLDGTAHEQTIICR